MIVGITFHYQPTIGWHDVLVTHVIPRACGFLTFIMILRTCAHVEVGAKREVSIDGCSFGNPSCHARESRKGLNTINLFPIMPSVANRRAIKRVTVTTRETTLKQLLVVNHHFISIATGIVAPKTTLCMFTPKANATLRSGVQACPRTVHRNNPCTPIQSFGCSQSILCLLYRLGQSIGKVHVHVI